MTLGASNLPDSSASQGGGPRRSAPPLPKSLHVLSARTIRVTSAEYSVLRSRARSGTLAQDRGEGVATTVLALCGPEGWRSLRA